MEGGLQYFCLKKRKKKNNSCKPLPGKIPDQRKRKKYGMDHLKRGKKVSFFTKRRPFL